MEVNYSNLMSKIIDLKLNIIFLIGSFKVTIPSAGNHQLGQWSGWSLIATIKRGQYRKARNQSGT